MSILIKNMEMPERCEGCLMYRHNAEYDYAYCCISSANVLGHGNARLNNCPLVEVPFPHGRLIDGEKAKEELRRAEALTRAFGYHYVIETISEAPTIIDAEEGEPDVSAD